MASIVNSFAISGVEGYLVQIEADTINGKASITIIGLGDQSIKEASERIQASIIHNNYEIPKMKIVINLAPSDIKKKGSHFDLAMAIGLLKQSHQINTENLDEYGFIGELSLNGRLRGVNGALPMIIAAKKEGIKKVIIPRDNYKEASLVKGITILPFDDIKTVIDFLEGKVEGIPQIEEIMPQNQIEHPYDFSDVKGQDILVEYIVVAASGGHNMLMIGEPGCGKSMIAKRISTILPRMTEEEALEVTKIYSVAGLLKNNKNLLTERPFRAPHHNASLNSLVGGGHLAMPGEVSLSHNGVLFLDEVAEFSRKTLEALRQPIEDKKVTIARVNGNNIYPANFMFIVAMNPCPCGYYGNKKCRCTDYEVQKYRQKISGPVLDRIDIQKYIKPVEFSELTNNKDSTSSSELRERVEFARNIQKERFKHLIGINCNAQMNRSLLKEFCILDDECKQILKLAHERFGYSARTFDKFLRVARTFADLDGSSKIRKSDIANVLLARDLDKENSKMFTI